MSLSKVSEAADCNRNIYKKMTCPEDGLLHEQEVQIKTKKTKNSKSKVYNSLLSHLDRGDHQHMLQYFEGKKKFGVKLTNKKSPKWTEKDISLFIALDKLSNQDFRLKEGKKYHEKCKVRFKSRMTKLKKYVKEEKPKKISTVETWKIYTILKRPVIGENTKKSAKTEEKCVNQKEEKTMIEGYETLRGFIEPAIPENDDKVKDMGHLSNYGKIECYETQNAFIKLTSLGDEVQCINVPENGKIEGYDTPIALMEPTFLENEVPENCEIEGYEMPSLSACMENILYENNDDIKGMNNLHMDIANADEIIHSDVMLNSTDNEFAREWWFGPITDNLSCNVNVHEEDKRYSDEAANIFESFEEVFQNLNSNVY